MSVVARRSCVSSRNYTTGLRPQRYRSCGLRPRHSPRVNVDRLLGSFERDPAHPKLVDRLRCHAGFGCCLPADRPGSPRGSRPAGKSRAASGVRSGLRWASRRAFRSEPRRIQRTSMCAALSEVLIDRRGVDTATGRHSSRPSRKSLDLPTASCQNFPINRTVIGISSRPSASVG